MRRVPRPERDPANEARWIWDASLGAYRWWDGHRWTTIARTDGDGWSYSAEGSIAASTTEAEAEVRVHERRFAIAAGVVVVALFTAFAAFLTAADPGPGEEPDVDAASTVVIAALVLCVLAAAYAAVELTRALLAWRRSHHRVS